MRKTRTVVTCMHVSCRVQLYELEQVNFQVVNVQVQVTRKYEQKIGRLLLK
jgi:hypothetical protein